MGCVHTITPSSSVSRISFIVLNSFRTTRPQISHRMCKYAINAYSNPGINQLPRFRIQKLKTTCLIFWKLVILLTSPHLIYCYHVHWTFLAEDHSSSTELMLWCLRPGANPICLFPGFALLSFYVCPWERWQHPLFRVVVGSVKWLTQHTDNECKHLRTSARQQCTVLTGWRQP